jgi:ketosteroid isomerase-like protein
LKLGLACAALALLSQSCAAVSTGASANDARAEIERALDALHRAASEADGATYFALFAPDAVFYGTDASERWTVEEFRAYAEPYFSQGRGWTYVPTERHVFVGASGDTAWFDERLQNEKYGEVRGTGVLVHTSSGWKIAQYNLAFPVPNELAADLIERVRALEK